jgi:hypothetical protein
MAHEIYTAQQRLADTAYLTRRVIESPTSEQAAPKVRDRAQREIDRRNARRFKFANR